MILDRGRDGHAPKIMPGHGSATRKVRLLHTSDIHVGVEHYPEEALHGLRAIADLTVGFKADALLIAGDLFDHDSLEKSLVAHAFEILGVIDVPVVVLPGNHDGLLLDKAFDGVVVPENVRLITHPEGELITLPGIGLSIWGKPVYHHLPSFHPLSGVPARPSTGWYVVMAHGLVVSDGNPDARSSPLFPDELANVNADYVALGHGHGFRDVAVGDTKTYYCGAPSGTNSPGAALVMLDPEEGVSVDKLRIPLRGGVDSIGSRIQKFGRSTRENGSRAGKKIN